MIYIHKSKMRIALLLVLAAIFLLLVNTRWFWHFFYPLEHRDIIFKYANQYNIDPYLVAAIIKAESNFDPAAKSEQGAAGLMQIMPETGVWAAGQIGLKNFTPGNLVEPEINIRLGTWYIASLKKEFGGDMILVLAAYNGGRSNVKEWLEQNKWTGEHADINRIPFPETRRYLQKVLKNYQKYRWIYLG